MRLWEFWLGANLLSDVWKSKSTHAVAYWKFRFLHFGG